MLSSLKPPYTYSLMFFISHPLPLPSSGKPVSKKEKHKHKHKSKDHSHKSSSKSNGKVASVKKEHAAVPKVNLNMYMYV